MTTQFSPLVRTRPARRQFQSCDSCRRRRKACDAGHLDTTSNTSDLSSAKQKGCTPCVRKGQKCTFDWLAQHLVTGKTPRKQAPPRSISPGMISDDFLQLIQQHEAAQQPLTTDTAISLPSESMLDEPYDQDSLLWFQDDGVQLSNPFVFVTDSPSRDGASLVAVPRYETNTSHALVGECSSSAEAESAIYHGSLDTQRDAGGQPVCSHFHGGRGLTALPHAIEQRLADTMASHSISDVFIRTYQNNLENALASWSTSDTCPYNVGLRDSNRAFKQQQSLLKNTTFYERVCRMDNAVHRLSLKCLSPLTVSQNEVASELLQKVVLAFSSQWSTNNQPCRESEAAMKHSFTSSLSQQLCRTLHKTLWHEAQIALHAAQGINSFKVIFAQLLFSFIRSPFDMESRNIMPMPQSPATGFSSSEGYGSSGSLTSHDKASTLGHTLCDEERSLDLLGQGEPPLHMESSLRQLLNCHRRLYSELRSSKRVSTDILQSRRAFREEFNLLYWLAVMCDTTSSAISGRSLVISDEDSAIEVPLDGWVNDRKVKSRNTASDHGVPGLVSDRLHAQKQRPIALWDSHLLSQVEHLENACIDWPIAEVEAERLLKEAIPLKVLLFRRVSQFQTLIDRGAADYHIENGIQDAILVYQQWNARYGGFMSRCVQDSEHLSHKLRCWHTILAAHWHYGAILLSEKLKRIDAYALGDPRRCMDRQRSGKALSLGVSNAICIAKLATPGPIDADLSLVLRAQAILSEPWCEIMIRALSKAASILLEVGREAPHVESDCMNKMELIVCIEACLQSLRELGYRCSSAATVAITIEENFQHWKGNVTS